MHFALLNQCLVDIVLRLDEVAVEDWNRVHRHICHRFFLVCSAGAVARSRLRVGLVRVRDLEIQHDRASNCNS